MTRREWARRLWKRELWPTPRDEAQERLYVLFWCGDGAHPDAPYTVDLWTRPPRWVEELVRA